MDTMRYRSRPYGFFGGSSRRQGFEYFTNPEELKQRMRAQKAVVNGSSLSGIIVDEDTPRRKHVDSVVIEPKQITS